MDTEAFLLPSYGAIVIGSRQELEKESDVALALSVELYQLRY